MNLNQVTVPVLDISKAISFYQKLGLKLIVKSLHYARFECPEGNVAFSIHQVEKLPIGEGVYVYFGFPLHAPGKPGIERAAHLSDIKIPQLFLQGTRDTLANFDLMEKVCKKLKKATLVKIEGGDHSFKTLKKSGITHEEAIEQLAKETAKFAAKL